MSNYSNKKAMTDYVGAHWPTTWKLVTQNVPEPTDRSKAWARLSFKIATVQAWDVQSSVERTNGWIWFQFFLPANTGDSEAFKMADAVRAMLFEKRIVDSLGITILTRAPELGYVAVDPSGDDEWRCIVPYQADADPYTQ